MHLSTLALPLLAVATQALLDDLAKKAGLMYFGAATDSPGQREREGLEAAYSEYDDIFAKEFGQTTPTNGMKWLFTEAEQGVFNFTEGEIVSAMAKENDMILRCHALVWHSQLGPWVEEKDDWTAEEMEAFIREHIAEVAGHWKGRCYAWDVVNEALNEDGTYRESVFYKVMGEDYIKVAFEAAAEADPDTKLYYNDYNLESVSPKSKAAIGIVEMLREAGLKVDGIGMQAHFVAHDAPSLEDQIAVIESYAAAGVEVALTELDVRIEMPVNDTNMAWQKQVYSDAVAACVMVEACVGITLWDFYDPFSWVPYVFTGEGAPLLWFEDFTTHPAYDGIVDVLKAGAPAEDGPSCSAKKSKRAMMRRAASVVVSS